MFQPYFSRLFRVNDCVDIHSKMAVRWQQEIEKKEIEK